MTPIVLDLEPVCQVADLYIQQFNLQGKISTKLLDFFKEEFPKDCDIAFFRILFMTMTKRNASYY
jgi:hypothetical protein